MATGLPILSSPKRKRVPSESAPCASSASSPSTVSASSLYEARLREGDNWGRNSPRLAVAGRLGALAIHSDQLLNFEPPNGNNTTNQFAPFAQPRCWTGNNMPPILPTIEGNPNPNQALVEPTKKEDPTTPPSPTKKQKRSSSTPRKKRSPMGSPKMRKPRLSPPLTSSTSEDPFTWHDDEITGHNPTDPNDDGYGINGIGFKPTAAIAWARTEKRRRQVADWKNREAREARERRREKREGVDLDRMRTTQTGAVQKKVKFEV